MTAGWQESVLKHPSLGLTSLEAEKLMGFFLILFFNVFKDRFCVHGVYKMHKGFLASTPSLFLEGVHKKIMSVVHKVLG